MDISNRYGEVLKCFTCLPQKILSRHGIDNMTEFVLHTLCNEQCLDLSKAAYFVDNADFNCLKGVAGFDGQNRYEKGLDLWEYPEEFTHHMKKCNFNNKVREICHPSAKKNSRDSQDLMYDLAQVLAINDPVIYGWDNKHQNFGIVIFELPKKDKKIDKDILQGLSFLGFCPVF